MRPRLRAVVLLVLIVAVLAAAAFMMSTGARNGEIRVVEAWTAARNAGNIDAALALLSADAVVLDLDVSDPDGLARLRSILEAQKVAGWRIDETGCAVDGARITCRYAMHDELLRKCGLQFTGDHMYVVADGKIDRQTRRHDGASRTEVYGALDRFRAWVRTNHPDAVGVIWVDPSSATYTTLAGAQAVMALLDEYPC